VSAAPFPPRQLPLPLPHAESHDPADLLEDASNREALAWLRRPAEWPNGRLALAGPPATGKTHMLHGLAARRGWPVVDGAGLRGLPEVPEDGAAGAGLAVDDADCAPEETALLHLLNICAERGLPLLLAGREPPARWPVALPDLRSRLRATAVAAVRPPEDALLAALLRKHFADRQLRLDPALAADGPHADVYRGLAAMATYHRARRELLFSRFLALWQEPDHDSQDLLARLRVVLERQPSQGHEEQEQRE